MTAMFCGDCGTPRRTPDQRFCAECGVAYDATPAPASAAPVTGPVPAYAPAPDYAVPAAVGSGRRGPRVGRLVGVGALVLAVGGAGLVGWQVFGPKGGADSPEAAASTFVSSLAEQDGVGLISVVNPDEVAGLDDVYETALDRLEEEGLIAGGEISGAVDLDFDDLGFRVDELGDGVARVTLDQGTMTATYDPQQLPDRLAFVADDYPDAESETVDLAEVVDDVDDDSGVELGLTTVEVDGRWYVSLLGTAADLLYQDYSSYADLRRPDYDATSDEVDPVVGETPEDVVDNLVDAVNSNDVDQLLAQLPAGLSAGLRPYARTVQALLEDGSVSASVVREDLEVETEDLGDDLVKVTLEEARFSAEGYADGEGGNGSVTLYDACYEATGQSYYDDDSSSASDCLPDQILEDAGIDRPYVVMRQVGDGYQIDPVATLSSYARTIVENAPGALIDEALAAVETEDDSFFECYLGDYCEDDVDD